MIPTLPHLQTLLDVLAGRKTAGVREGVIEFGGQQPTIQFLRRYTGYVEQFDTLIGQLTVREMVSSGGCMVPMLMGLNLGVVCCLNLCVTATPAPLIT
jgi:hypothetical protein